MATEYKPGQEVPSSGIYEVTHDDEHVDEHEVTCVKGERFPPCNHCGNHPRFRLVRQASHVKNHKEFKK
jgi:hypothetical protein